MDNSKGKLTSPTWDFSEYNLLTYLQMQTRYSHTIVKMKSFCDRKPKIGVV